MKIEIKPETFKHLMSLLNQEVAAIPYQNDIIDELKPQYDACFNMHEYINN